MKAWILPIHNKSNPLDVKYIISQTKEIIEIQFRKHCLEFTPICEATRLALDKCKWDKLIEAEDGYIIINEEDCKDAKRVG